MFLDAVVFLIAAYFLFDMVRAYRAAIGTVWQRSVSAAKGAAASLWTGFAVLVTLLVSFLAQVADLVNAPSVGTAIQTYLSPKVVAGIMVAVAIITELRRRQQAK